MFHPINLNNELRVEPNFLSKEDITFFVNFLDQTSMWLKDSSNPIWDERTIQSFDLPINIKTKIISYRKLVSERIQNFFNLNKVLYCDCFNFVRWRIGDKIDPPHADKENIDGSYHPYHYREYSSIIYLNNNFEGGEIFFSNFGNLKPNMDPGTLLIFPGNLKYLHGVTEVTNGIRYTIAGFFTSNSKYHDGLSI